MTYKPSESQPTRELRELRRMEVARRRSKLVANPLCAINTKSAEGRALYDLTIKLLEQSTADTSDPLVIRDAIAAAQMQIRLDALRANNGELADIARLEWIVKVRLRYLGITLPVARKRRPLPTSRAAHEMSDSMRAT
jgi:hypothetical protein